MITPSYSATATERVLPRMALDFTTGVLDPRVTVTRALNTATRVNSSGFIEIVNANLPRFDYKPTTLAPNGLLIEEARTNIALQSQAIETASWVKTNATVSADAIISPDGTLNADKLVENTANGTHDARSNQTTTAAVHTFSVYLKAAERNFVMLLHGQTSTAQVFNLNTGVTDGNAGFSAPVSSGVVNAGNGWYRVFITVNATAAVNSFRVYMMTDNVTYTYTGDGASGIFFGGAQIEAGAFATSYIPTVASTVTRNADVVSMTGANFSDWYNASEGAFVVEGSVQFGTTRYLIGGSASQRLVYGTSSGSLGIYDGTNVVNVAGGVSGQTFKIATSYGNAFGLAASLNGSVVAKGSYSGAFSVLTSIGIFSTSAGTATASGYAKKIYYYPLQLTDSEVRAFSK
jgi:hypothetical protein